MPSIGRGRSTAELRDIARIVAAERAAGTPWKVLMARFGLGRTRLYVLWREASQPQAVVAEKMFSEHHGACVTGAIFAKAVPITTMTVGYGAGSYGGHDVTMSFVKSLFSAPKPPPAPVLAPAPTPADPAVEEERRKVLVAASAAKGRASTNLTGGLGVVGEASTRKNVLLSA